MNPKYLEPAHRKRIVIRHRMKKFKSSEEEYYRLAKLGCAICGEPERPQLGKVGSFCIDHDHNTGLFRGLLCWPCNISLGHMRESSVLLHRAAKYLENSGSKKSKENDSV